jgi:hypothetical protein
MAVAATVRVSPALLAAGFLPQAASEEDGEADEKGAAGDHERLR